MSGTCEHTEHAVRGDGRYGRSFPRGGPDAGLWGRCAPALSAVEQAIFDRFETTCQTCYVDINLHPISLRGSWVACTWAERLAAPPLCDVCDDQRRVTGRWVPSGAERDAGKDGSPVELPCPSCAAEVPR